MLADYHQQAAERTKLGIPPLPLNAAQTAELCELLKNPPEEQKGELLSLLRDRVPPGVDEAAYVKAGFLTGVAKGEISYRTKALLSKHCQVCADLAHL
jgi:aconitate hydratase 2/2-methylisocitrate dehydratase